MRYCVLFGACILLPVFFSPCHAIDALSVVAGGGDSTDMLRLELQSNWGERWFAGDRGYLSGFWDIDLADWRQEHWHNLSNKNHNIVEIGVTPVFRYQGYGNEGYYIDAGIGMHQLSDAYDNGGRQLSTRFEFGTVVGAGYRFASGWECGANIEHYSNGGISSPNSGVNFLALRISKGF